MFEVGDRYVVVFHVAAGSTPWTTAARTTAGRWARAAWRGSPIDCPRHGAKFDIRDGRVLTMPAVSDTVSYPTKVEDGEVFVEVGD